MFALYDFIVRSNTEIEARQETIQQWYEFFERLNILMQDYTIDYEEYYNRQMVWCVAWWTTGVDFTWNIWLSGYCTEFTAYWNENSTKVIRPQRDISSWYHDIYYCSTDTHNPSSTLQGNNGLYVVVWWGLCWRVGSRQSYGQYEALFADVGGDTDYRTNSGDRIWDSDDKNLWKTVYPSTWTLDAIQDADHIQELYFISHDWKSRLYFRRYLANTWDNYTQYKIQMLRLRWFDAWQKHNFDTGNNEWLYDWKIDTWACDTWMWFEPEEKEGRINIWWAYSGYYIPATVDDCWIDLTHGSTTISAWNIIISPTTDSDLAWVDEDRQINAYMKILTVNWIYAPYYITKLSQSIRDYKVPLETLINMKDFYRE